MAAYSHVGSGENLRLVLVVVEKGDVEMRNEIPELGWTTRGRVSRVLDGDTVEVEVTRKFTVRLRDCWAPEVHRNHDLPEPRQTAELDRGLTSKRALEKLADGMQVVLHVYADETGDFRRVTTMGRVLGDVYLAKNGVSLAAAQVEAGNATMEKEPLT